MYKELITSDGSKTFFNEELQESYHSKSGAEEEALEKYAKPAISYFKNKESLVVFDVCFGLGYNSAAALDVFNDKKLSFYCFENDAGILSKIPFLDSNFKNYVLIKEFVNFFLLRKQSFFEKNNFSFNMAFGDFRECLKHQDILADCVFFDPFSPKNSPDLWGEDVFKLLFYKMNEQAVLFTYSCARRVRDGLKNAGFLVIDGPIIGRRSPGTIAIKEK